MKTLTTGSRLLKSVVLACAAALGLSAWAANAPTVTVNGTAVTISNESGVETWDNAGQAMGSYSGKAFTIPAATDLAAGTILKLTSVSFAKSTSQSLYTPKINISGVVSDTATVTTGGFTAAAADKITYSFADVNCLVKVGTASQIRFLTANGEDSTATFAFRLGLNAYQFIESIVWSSKAPIIEIEAEIVEGYVNFAASSGNGWGFESGTGSGKVYLSGYKNYMKTPGDNEKEIVLVDGYYGYAFDIKDANSMSSQNPNQITDWAKISGDGTLTTASANSSRLPFLLLRDTSDFTGTINATASCKLTTVFCGTSETFGDGVLYNKLFANYTGSMYVTSERSTANSNVVTVPSGKTWTGTALLNEGETVVDGTFSGPVVNSGTLTVNGTVIGEIANSGSGTVTVNAGATISPFGSVRDFTGFTVDSSVAAAVTMTSEEYGKGSISITGATGISSLTVLAPDGTTTLGTITPDTTGAGELALASVNVSGLACWADYEMNGNLNSTGSDTTSLTYDSGSSVDNFYNASMLYTYRHPYRNITYPSTWTAVVRCTVPKVANGAVITFGTKEGGLIGLVAGNDPETEMKLIKTTGNSAYETLATMSIVDGTSAQHVYIFAVETNSTIKVYCDGSEVLNQTYTAFTLGGGIQIGSVHGGVGNTGITAVWKGTSYTGLTDEDLEQARIDCVRLYDYSLSAAQVAAISAEFPAVKLYRATVAAEANTTWGALEWSPAWDGGNSSSKVILTASGDATVALPATLTAEEVQLVIPAASTLTLAGNSATLAITEPLDVSGGTVELTGAVTLTSDLTISGKVKFNGFTATGADVKIASGATVTAADAMVVVALGTYTCTEGTVVDSSNNIGGTVKFIPLSDAQASVTSQGVTMYYSTGSDGFNAFAAAVAQDDGAILTILDGTDYSAYNSQFVTLGYYYNQSEGTITKAYARISGVDAVYSSLAAAISAATDGQTVVLVRASAEAVTLNKSITLTEQAAFSGTLSGTGTLTLTALRSTALAFDNWTGTVAITPAITDGSAGFRFNYYGTTGSTVSLVGGLSGGAWLANVNIAPTVNLVGDFALGGFSASFPNTFSKLTGSGAFKLTADGTATGYADGYFLVQDVSEFTGDIQVVKPGLAIGSSKPASPTTYGQIVISKPVTVGATATWTASNGIVLADTTATLTVPSGATVPVPTTSVQYGEILTTTGSQGETIYSVGIVSTATVTPAAGGDAVSYPTLALAVAAATSGDTVTLLADVDVSDEGVTFPADTTLTLDLNNCTITAANTETGHVQVNGALTITDNSEGAAGKIVSGTSGTYGVVQVAENGVTGASLTIAGGAIEAYFEDVTDSDGQHPAYGVVVKGTGTSFTMTGGSVTAGYMALMGHGSKASAGTYNISGGTITSMSDFAAYFPTKGDCAVTISGGTFTGAGALGVRAGTLSITGGTFTASGTGIAPGASAGTAGLYFAALATWPNYGDVTVTVSGGSFTSASSVAAIVATDSTYTAATTLTGGTYSTDVSDYCATGYEATEDSGVWTVTALPNYTVTFDADGGTPAPAAQTVQKGSTATVPTEPTKDGFTFAGWTLGGSAYDFATPVTSNITLVASWTSSGINPTDPTSTQEVTVDTETYTTEEDQKTAAIAAATVTVPDGVSGVDAATYKTYFTYSATPTATAGTYAVAITGFADEVTETADGNALSALEAATAGTALGTIEVKPGLYYGTAAGADVTTLKAPAGKLNTTGTLSLSGVTKPSTGEAFFIKIKVGATAFAAEE